MPFLQRVQIIFLFTLAFFILYFSSLQWPFSEVIYELPFLPFEKAVPFIPSTIVFYLLCYAMPPFAFMVIKQKKDLFVVLRAFLLAVMVQYIFWMLFPVAYPDRPSVNPGDGWTHGLVYALYWFDYPPMNCFPSLHVSMACLSYYVIKMHLPVLKRLFFILAFCIAVSTLTLKQHYALDVLSGFAVAWVVNRFFLMSMTKSASIKKSPAVWKGAEGETLS